MIFLIPKNHSLFRPLFFYSKKTAFRLETQFLETNIYFLFFNSYIMSIVSAIKDSLELLNNVYDSVSGELTFFKLIQETFFFLLESIKNIIYYVLSFQWIHDFAYLPVLIPQISSSILRESFFIENPSSNLFSFLEIPSYNNDKFLIGFLNSFFLSLPITTSHILATRTLLIQGITAGISSIFGIVFGQWLFITCIIFGFRFIIIPWLTLEPLSYFLGLVLIFKTVYSMIREPIRVTQTFEKTKLLKFFLLHFVLAWCEQSCIFQYLGNITLSADPTTLENFYTNKSLESFLIHFNYSLGLLFGSLFFSLLFAFIFVNLQSKLFFKKIFTTNRIHFSFLTLSIAFTLSSIPFYGFDYLFTGPLGFVSQDKALQKTIFAQTNLKDTILVLGLSSGLYSSDKANFESLDTDVAPFDRGNYLTTNIDQSFEDLNYQGEYHWTRRNDHLSGTDRRFKRWSQRFFGVGKKKENSFSEANSLKTEVDAKKSSIGSFNTKDNEIEKPWNQEYTDLLSKVSSQVQNSYLYNQIDPNTNLNELQTFLELTKSSFSNSFIKKVVLSRDPPILEKKMKEKYYSNPVYQFLLNRDIDFFVKRQPKTFLLTADQEKHLMEKRLILSNYYDSLRDYTQIQKKEEFTNFFNGSKSYADRIYNQQFKGTLRVVRRLFSLNLNEAENDNLKLVLKYDQPLYVFDNNATSKKIENLFHEELKNLPQETTFQAGGPSIENQGIKSLEGSSTAKTSEKIKKPFFELTYPIPFYAGWDENLRKLVLTNRLSPRYFAGTQFIITDNFAKNLHLSDASALKLSKKIKFTAWPIPKKILDKPKSQSTIPYTTLFETFSDPINQHFDILSLFNQESSPSRNPDVWDYSSLPSNIERYRKTYNFANSIPTENISDVLAPQRGGFIWPGNEKLKFKLDLNKFTIKIVNNS